MSRQAAGSPTHFLLDGDIKYLLSEVFAAALLQLTASTKMLRKGVGELLCPHSLLSFAMVTQKFLGFVALLLSVSDGQHIKIYDGFPFGSTILDLPVPAPCQTAVQLSGNSVQLYYYKFREAKGLTLDITSAAEQNLALAFQELQSCQRLCANYDVLVSSALLAYTARHHPAIQPGQVCFVSDRR